MQPEGITLDPIALTSRIAHLAAEPPTVESVEHLAALAQILLGMLMAHRAKGGSEEAAEAGGNLSAIASLRARLSAQQVRSERAEADAALLRNAIRAYIAARDAQARDATWQRMRDLAEEVSE